MKGPHFFIFVILYIHTFIFWTISATAERSIPIIPHVEIPIHLSSGPLKVPESTLIRKVVYSYVVKQENRAWIRIKFDPGKTSLRVRSDSRSKSSLALSSDGKGFGINDIITLTSAHDGHQQILDAATLKIWGFTSAYFNGPEVKIEVSVYSLVSSFIFKCDNYIVVRIQNYFNF